MKLIPLAIILAAAFLCSTIRNRIDPTPTPLPTLGSTPTPIPTISPAATPEDSSTANGRPVPKTVSGGVLNGKAKSLPQPPYPPAAKAVRAAGSVTVQVIVDERGKVISANAVSGHPLLKAAAEAAARSAELEPTILVGKPVKVTGVLIYKFEP